MKTLIIIVLILVILGLYYFTPQTKVFLKTTGAFVKEFGSTAWEKVSGFLKDEVKDGKENSQWTYFKRSIIPS